MYKNNTTKAFTLGEIMVGIAIIGIIALGITNMDFNRLSKNQEAEIELVKIINIIEEAKNNALIGRGVEANLENPSKWSVIINTAASGSIKSQWELASGATGSLNDWEASFPFEIINMECQTTDGSSIDSSTSSIVYINYTGANAELVGCSSNIFKKLVFDFGSVGRTTEISINAVTGVIEKQ